MRMIRGREKRTEVVLGADRYMIMECVSRQAKEFRFAEMYYLLKKFDSGRWQPFLFMQPYIMSALIKNLLLLLHSTMI